MGWFDSIQNPKLKSSKKVPNNIPAGLWKKCTKCKEIVQNIKLQENLHVCPYCQHHFRLSATDRLNLLIDEDTFQPFGKFIGTTDPLKFKDKVSYHDRLKAMFDKTGSNDGTICGLGKINGIDVSIAVMNFAFMGGSMGVATGEKIALCFDKSYESKIPCIVISSSGGARMQEGILSLMQMAKTSASRQRLRANNIPYISVLADPTTGGVAASFAMTGDINIAEPKALIGFAGPRVIEQSIRQTLPDGFQRSEFLLDHGFIDSIVERKKLKAELSFYLKFFQK